MVIGAHASPRSRPRRRRRRRAKSRYDDRRPRPGGGGPQPPGLREGHTIPRRIELLLLKKNVRAIAALLEEEAPRTCAAVWDALPIEGETFHAKWAGRELYTLVPPLASRPGEENATITPIPGDVLYFDVSPDSIDLPVAMRRAHPKGLVDLAVFYGRNNLLLGPAGFMPGNLFATITEGLADYARACAELFREGVINERFAIRRVEAPHPPATRAAARRGRPR